MIATWSSAFATGIELIDEQHKELFRIFRDLDQMVLTECKQYEYKAFVDLACEIRDYMTYHFYTEEKFMKEIDYPEIENHKKGHEAFIKEINKINYIELERNPFKIMNHLRGHVELWIMQHILLEDIKIAKYLKL